MIRFFTTHPTAAQIIMILLIAVGLVSLPRIKRETFPDFSPQQVEIRVIYPGASSEDVEIGICRKLEQAIEAIDDLEEYRCLSQESLGVLTAKMVDQGNVIKFLNDINSQSTNPESITISIGITDYLNGMEVNDIFEKADKALYLAKEKGKNRIEVFRPEQPSNSNIIEF